MQDTLYPNPIEGVPMYPPKKVPKPGAQVIGYELIDPSEAGVFCKPVPNKLNRRGLFAILACLFCCWPASCVPCFTSCSYSKYQRPVYED